MKTKKKMFKFVSIAATIFMCASIFQIGTPEIFADAITNTNLITNGDFEKGNVDGWIKNGNPTLSATKEEAASGSYSMKVTGRQNTFEGPAYDLKAVLVPGETYNVSVKVKAVAGQLQADSKHDEKVNIIMDSKSDADENDTYSTIAYEKQISENEWTTITGTYTLKSGKWTTIKMYIESPDKTLQYYIDDVTVVDSNPNANQAPTEIQQNVPSLYKALGDDFPNVGVAVGSYSLVPTDMHSQIVEKHFNTLVAENEMKPSSLQPTRGRFTFDNADTIASYAVDHNMKMRGHTLLWHSQVPDWFFQDPNDETKPATREQLLSVLHDHITTVLTHFKTKYGEKNPIYCWDVVNEVLNGDGSLRDSKWLQIIGPDYIKYAFQYAHEADPNMKLYINDYGIEGNNAKTQGMYNLVKSLLDAGIHVDGVGFQMHISITNNVNDIKASIEKIASLGVKIQVTELDMSTNGDVSTNALLQQARVYKNLFDMFKNEKKYINTVVFWNISDDITWLDKPNAPLLFDSKLQVKPAYWALVDPSKVTVNRQSLTASQGTPVLGTSIDKAWITEKPFEVNTFAKGLSGANAKVKLLWDDKYLYVLANVNDNTSGAKDSLELYVDKKDGKTTTYQEYDKHYIIGRDNSGSTDIKHFVQSDANGYTVQAAIPISDITPQIGSTLGFDIRVNDDQGSGTIVSQAVWNDYSDNQDTNTAYYGDLTLSKPSQLTTAVYGTPVVDGNIDDIWNNAKAIATNTWVTGTSGATAKVRTMWDNSNLYLLIEVADSCLNKSSANNYEQDSVEVFIDQNDNKTTSYEKDDYQIRVNYDNEQSFGSTGKPDGFQSATSKTSTGYVIEEKIPITAVKVEDGTIMGFDIQVNDSNDQGKRTGVVTWCDGSGVSYANTSNYGNLKLLDTRQVPVVSASVKGGEYRKAKKVTLASDIAADIYYTTDGSMPTTASKKYTSPVKIKKTTTLKFIAVSKLNKPSVVYSESYIINKKKVLPKDVEDFIKYLISIIYGLYE